MAKKAFSRGRKGQSLIFEQVILFGISVAIFLVCYAVFNIYQNFYISVNSVNQLDEAKEWISASILRVAGERNSSSLSIIPIPRRIGEAVYQIEVSGAGLELRNLLTNVSKNSTLYSLGESFSLGGKTTSIRGKIAIKKEASQITIS